MSVFATLAAKEEGSVDPLALLAGLKHGPKMRRALMAYALGTATWQGAKKVRDWLRAQSRYTVSLDSRDDIYDDVHDRLSEMIPTRDRRAVLAVSFRDRRRSRKGDGMEIRAVDDTSPEPRTRLATFYDGDTTQQVRLGGYTVDVQVVKEGLDLGALSADRGAFKGESLRFTANSEEGRDAVVQWLSQIAEERNEGDVPRLHILGRWSSFWERRGDLEPRTLDSVVLRAGQINGLVEDLGTFLSLRKQYARFGLPYHRGYLFHGPPGTGKTSLARALAHHFGLDVYYAPLSDLDKDANLLHLISQVRAGSVLLLEDVDVLHAATSRDDEGNGVTLSGLLNALDGVSTPSGIVTIMTTNDRSVLDPALVRPGRVDRIERIDYLDRDQLGQLVELVVGERVALPFRGSVTPADVLEVFKRHLDEPKLALDDLRALLGTR